MISKNRPRCVVQDLSDGRTALYVSAGKNTSFYMGIKMRHEQPVVPR